MKKTRKTARKKLRTSVKASSRAAEMDDEYFDEESNMRLSRAFVVVLILHVVAVGGILLFNNLKANQEAGAATVLNDLDEQPEPVANSEQSQQTEVTHRLGAGDTLSKLSRKYGVSVQQIIDANELRSANMLRVGQELVIPLQHKAGVPNLAQLPPVAVASEVVEPKATGVSQAVQPVPASGTYTVVKGDNPHAIARKFNVSYEKLLELNNIEDPRLLQIGQVLKIPTQE